MVKVKSIRPVFTRIITTADRYKEDNFMSGTGLLDANKQAGRYKEFQKVVKIGSSVREVKVGDVVLIDPSRYMSRKYDDNSLRNDFVENPIVSINIPTVQMEDEDFFMIDERDVVYVIEDYVEEPDTQSTIIMPKPTKVLVN